MKVFVFLAVFALFFIGSAAACSCPDGCCYGSDVDHWANIVYATTGTVNSADNALGAADGAYAHVLGPDSSITLDMGAGEEVCETDGVDISFYNDNSCELVDVYVAREINDPFVMVANDVAGCGTVNVYTGASGYEYIRYVKIAIVPGYSDAEIDAVNGICINCGRYQVPEFGIVAALGILGAAGYFIAKKRR